MSRHRDDAYFAQQEASQSGYRDGHDSAERGLHRDLAETFGIGVDVSEDLTGRDITRRFSALQIVSDAISQRIDEERSRIERYGSADPGVVADMIIEEQSDVKASMAEDERGYSWSDPNKYQFAAGDDDTVTIKSPFVGLIRDYSLDAEWVKERMLSIGFNRNEAFCGQVVEKLSLLIQPQEVEVV